MTTASMFSPDWYRVAALRLRLRPRAELHRRDLRGRLWYVVRDHQSGRYYRLSPAAYLLVCLLDGRRTIREAWELVGRRYGPEQPSQDEIILLLAQLHRADLLLGELPPDIGEVARRSVAHERQTALARLRNPLALRLPLFDPDRFLDADAAGGSPAHFGARSRALAGARAHRFCRGGGALGRADGGHRGQRVQRPRSRAGAARLSAGESGPRTGPCLRVQALRRRGA